MSTTLRQSPLPGTLLAWLVPPAFVIAAAIALGALGGTRHVAPFAVALLVVTVMLVLGLVAALRVAPEDEVESAAHRLMLRALLATMAVAAVSYIIAIYTPVGGDVSTWAVIAPVPAWLLSSYLIPFWRDSPALEPIWKEYAGNLNFGGISHTPRLDRPWGRIALAVFVLLVAATVAMMMALA